MISYITVVDGKQTKIVLSIFLSEKDANNIT